MFLFLSAWFLDLFDGAITGALFLLKIEKSSYLNLKSLDLQGNFFLYWSVIILNFRLFMGPVKFQVFEDSWDLISLNRESFRNMIMY